MRGWAVEPGSNVSGMKILTTRLHTVDNDFGSISTFKICKVLAFIDVTADRHVVQTQDIADSFSHGLSKLCIARCSPTGYLGE